MNENGKEILPYLRSKRKNNNADLIEKLFEDDALARISKNYLDGKVNPEDIISPQVVTVFRTYIHLYKINLFWPEKVYW